MSDEAISDQASDLKPVAPASASSSSFSVTDILSPLEVVANSANNTDAFSANNSNSRPRSDLIETASYMGPTSPSAATASANGDTSAHGKKNYPFETRGDGNWLV